MKKILLPILALTLAGCNQAVLPDMTTTGSVFGANNLAAFGGHKAAAYEHTIAEKRPVQDAFLKLPRGSGDVVDVTERRHSNGVEQLIVYAGDYETRGENVASVQLKVNKTALRKPKGNLKITPPSEAALAREMRKVLPGVSMNVSNEFHTNAYGPFGYALGRATGNVNCIYGWQHMRGNAKNASEFIFLNKPSDKPELSLRLRVCRHNASSTKLVDLMRNLRIDADPARALSPTRVSWNAGPGGNTSLAMPAYEQGGYVSDEIVAVEPAPQVKPVVVHKNKPRKVVAKKAAPKPATPSNVVAKAAAKNYAPVPLPTGNVALVKPSTVNKTAATVVPVANPPKTASETSLALSSPVKKKKLKNGFAAVPLPE